MYVVGFAETVRDLLKENNYAIIDGGMNDVRVVGLGRQPYAFKLNFGV